MEKTSLSMEDKSQGRYNISIQSAVASTRAGESRVKRLSIPPARNESQSGEFSKSEENRHNKIQIINQANKTQVDHRFRGESAREGTNGREGCKDGGMEWRGAKEWKETRVAFHPPL